MAEVPVSSEAAIFTIPAKPAEKIPPTKSFPEGKSLTPQFDIYSADGRKLLSADEINIPDINDLRTPRRQLTQSREPLQAIGGKYPFHLDQVYDYDGGDEFASSRTQEEDTTIDFPTPPFEPHEL